MIKWTEYRLLGCRLSALTREQWFQQVERSVVSPGKRTLLSQNLHSAFIRRRSQELARAQEAAHVVRIDGMPFVLWARILGLRVSTTHRSGFFDLLPGLLSRAAARGWRITLVGGRPGVGEEAARRLRAEYPGLNFCTCHGYFSMDEDSGEVRAVVDYVNSTRPDIVIVGMGMPRQESFVLKYAAQIEASTFLTCGAAFDYVAGEIPTSPRWLSRAGLEWAYRLAAQPRALWKRYLVEPLFLIPLAARDVALRLSGDTMKWRGGGAGRSKPA